jgi:hypothetical protein
MADWMDALLAGMRVGLRVVLMAEMWVETMVA